MPAYGLSEAPARTYLGKPAKVIELALLAAVISPAVLVITTAGTAQVLSQQGSEGLPLVYVLLAAVSIPLASGISAALGRWTTSRICRVLCWASLVLCLILEGALALELPGAPQAICTAAYLLEIVFDTLFWLTVSEYLTTRELKLHAPFLAMAFGVGGILGGFLATAFCAYLPADDLLLLNAALFGLCLVQFMRIDGRSDRLASDHVEAEESGFIEAARSTLVVLRAFPLTGAIGAGIFLMSGLFCLQDYLCMTIYAANMTDKDSLASFMAMVYAGQQAAEFAILALLGRLILERARPLVRNLFFPVTTLAVLAALQSCWTLPIAALVHTNASAVSNAIFEPVKNLNYAALPFRMLGPVRMLVEGVVYPAGVALSGGALLWMQSALAPQVVLAVALVLAVLFAAASAIVGLSFLPSLLRSLRLRAVSPSEYSTSEPGRRFSQADIRYLLLHPDPEARSFGRDLARRLAPHLLRCEDHGRPPIWEAGATAIERLAQGLSPERCAAPGLSVASGSGAVRFDGGRADRRRWKAGGNAALSHGDRRRRTSSGPNRSKLADMGCALEDADSAVRRSAVRLLDRNADAVVSLAAERLGSEQPEVAETSMRSLGGITTHTGRRVLRGCLPPLGNPRRRLDRAPMQHRTMASQPDTGRRNRAGGLSDSKPWSEFSAGRNESGAGRFDAGRTATAFDIPDDHRQRRASVSEIAELGRGLEHACGAARRTAARFLARNGDAAVSTAAQRLSSDRPEVVEAAIQTLGAIGTRKARRVLRDYLRPLYHKARLNLAALQHVATVTLSETARRDLTAGLADSNRRIVRRVLAVKSALGNRRDINLLLSLTRTGEPRVRSDAVEALTSLPTGRLIRPVLALLEVREGSARESVTPTRSDRTRVADPAIAVWRAAADDRWLRLLAARLFGHPDEGTRSDGDDVMLDLVLFLKSVPLFREVSFEDIARIVDKTETVAVAQGEVLFDGGESITHIYIVRSGSIELYRGGMTVEIMVAGASVGEHAIFGDARHEVSARAAVESLLLRFPVSIISDLVAENPQSLGPMVGDLMRRVNLLHARLAESVRRPAGSQRSWSSINEVAIA